MRPPVPLIGLKKGAGTIRPKQPVVTAAGVADLLRPIAFLFCFLLALLTLTPFADRSGAAMLDTFEGGSLGNRILYPILLVTITAIVWSQQRSIIWTLLLSPAIPFAMWTMVASVASNDPALSARRSILFVIHIVITSLAMALPSSERQLQRVYAIGCLVVLGLCYFGVSLLPGVSIHQASDAIETDLAGNWRGVFEHKNAAGCVMVVFAFIGLYLAQQFNKTIGWLIVVAAVVFLIFTRSKTSMALLPFTLLLGLMIERSRSNLGRACLALSLLVAFNVFAVAVSHPGVVRQTMRSALPNVTFTGRTDLWAFAVSAIVERPLFGQGPGAFWRTGKTMYKDRERPEPEDISGWAAELGTDSHNGYLETAVSAGIPGLLLLLWWLVVTPLRDYPNAVREPENQPLARLFMRVWLYALYLSCLETVPATQNPAWFLMLQAMFGLTLLARRRVVRA